MISFDSSIPQKYYFSGFQKRNQALNCIFSQAKYLDVNLSMKEKDKDKIRVSSATEAGHMYALSSLRLIVRILMQ